MSDIVEMLLATAGGNEAHVCAIAAAEIERLRGLLQEALDPYLRATVDWSAGWTDRVREALGDER